MADFAPAALTIKDAVNYSGLARSRIYELFAAGVLHPRRAGRRTIIFRAELDAYLKSLPPAPIRVRQAAKNAA